MWGSGCATYALHPGELASIGRHPDCEIVVPLRSVSRRHACLSVTMTGVADDRLATIEDVGGRGGIRVRGQRIAPNRPFPVFAGDVIEINGVMCVLHAPGRDGGPSHGPFARPVAARPSPDDPAEDVQRLIESVAFSDLGVLLLGESGVGKSFHAHAIHSRSGRSNRPLLRIDCTSDSESDFTKELFAPGGVLERASDGTAFLHDVDELPLGIQDKLLAAIEARQVGARFIASSRRDLFARAAAGAFRLELLQHLSGIALVIAPLRERSADIPGLARAFLAEAAERVGNPRPHRLSSEALGVLVRHGFRGNVRELKTTMELAFQLAGPRFIGPEHLRFDASPGSRSSDVLPAQLATTRRFAPISPTEPPTTATEEIPVVVIPPTPRVVTASKPPPLKPPRAPRKRSR
jgi:hypothetical protein